MNAIITKDPRKETKRNAVFHEVLSGKTVMQIPEDFAHTTNEIIKGIDRHSFPMNPQKYHKHDISQKCVLFEATW